MVHPVYFWRPFIPYSYIPKLLDKKFRMCLWIEKILSSEKDHLKILFESIFLWIRCDWNKYNLTNLQFWFFYWIFMDRFIDKVRLLLRNCFCFCRIHKTCTNNKSCPNLNMCVTYIFVRFFFYFIRTWMYWKN